MLAKDAADNGAERMTPLHLTNRKKMLPPDQSICVTYCCVLKCFVVPVYVSKVLW